MDAGKVPIWEKVTLSIEEAMEYSGIGEKTIRRMLREPGCPFVIFIGKRMLVKRREFEKYISKHESL